MNSGHTGSGRKEGRKKTQSVKMFCPAFSFRWAAGRWLLLWAAQRLKDLVLLGKDPTTKTTKITKPDSNLLGHSQEVKQEPAAQTCSFNLFKKPLFYPRNGVPRSWAALQEMNPQVLSSIPHTPSAHQRLASTWRLSEIITINISYFGLVISIYIHTPSSSKCQGSCSSDIFQKGKGFFFFFANLSFLICSKLKPELFSETSS